MTLHRCETTVFVCNVYIAFGSCRDLLYGILLHEVRASGLYQLAALHITPHSLVARSE